MPLVVGVLAPAHEHWASRGPLLAFDDDRSGAAVELVPPARNSLVGSALSAIHDHIALERRSEIGRACESVTFCDALHLDRRRGRGGSTCTHACTSSSGGVLRSKLLRHIAAKELISLPTRRAGCKGVCLCFSHSTVDSARRHQAHPVSVLVLEPREIPGSS